jgi:hypothetical protein
MADSGISGSIGLDSGWISGGVQYGKQEMRRDKFLSDHPGWTIAYVRSMGRYEASAGDYDTELVILQDRGLCALMDRLEARYAPKEAEANTA